MYKLHDWIDINKLDWDGLSRNPNAIRLLKKNQNKINWNVLIHNENATEILENNKKKKN